MFDRITVDPYQMDGVPCLRRLRIPVATIVGMVAEGIGEGDILKSFPDLEPEDIRAALQYTDGASPMREQTRIDRSRSSKRPVF